MIVVAIACSSYAQIIPGGGGGGGGWTVDKIRHGTDSWQIPIYVGNTLTTKKIELRWDEGTPNVGKWYVGEGENSLVVVTNPPPIPRGWYSMPPTSSGSHSCTGSYEFIVHRPAGNTLKSVWISVNSSAAVSAYNGPNDPYPTLSVSNGQGDPVSSDPWSKTTSGKHLKRLSINDQGLGNLTISINASLSATGSNVTIEGSVTGDVAKDPRSISVPDSYDVEDLSVMDTFIGFYEKYHKLDAPNGVLPVLDIDLPVSISYNKAKRVLIEPDYSSNLSVVANYKAGVPPQEWVQISSGPFSFMTIAGSRTSPMSSSASYSGANGSETITWSSSYNESSNSGSSVKTSDTASLSSQVEADGAHIIDYVRNQSAVRDVYHLALKASGNFSSIFSFQDGLKGDAKITYSYKPKEDQVSKKTEKNAVFPPSKHQFVQVMPWYNASDQYTSQNSSVPDFLSIGSFALIIASEFRAVLPLKTLFSLAAAGLGSYLDSSLNSPSTVLYNRDRSLSQYWKIDINDWQILYPYDKVTVAGLCNEWKLEIAPHYNISFYVMDEYLNDGFSQRRMGFQAVSATVPGTAIVGDRYEQYRMASVGNGGGNNH